MANKKTLAGMLVGLLTFGMLIVGCDNSSATVTISGTAKVGETLTAVIHDGYSSLRLAYQWMRMPDSGGASENIGANQNTYLLTAADVGSRIKVKVTYTLSNGSTSELVSEPTETVIAASRVVAEQYRFASMSGTIITASGGSSESVTITMNANSISWTGSATGSLDGVYTQGGIYPMSWVPYDGGYTATGWAYVYQNDDKIGIVVLSSIGTTLYIGAATSSTSGMFSNITADFAGIRQYPSISR